MREVPKDELKVGTAYRVEFSDCCVSGEFTSAFRGRENEEDEFDYATLLFANGRIYGWNVSFYEVE